MMALDNKRINLIIILALALIFVVGGYFILSNEVSNIEEMVISRAGERSNKVKVKLVLLESFIRTLRDSMEHNILWHEKSRSIHPALGLSNYILDTDLAVMTREKSDRWFDVSGVLVSGGTLEEIELIKKQEMSAALSLESIFVNTVETIPDLKWVYYVSDKSFSYSFPYFAPESSQLDINITDQEYWIKAIPENNPQRRLIMTNIYQDSAGKGEMVTFSLPVYQDSKFRGIIAIDISLDSTNEIMKSNSYIGESYLIDEKKSIIAAQSIDERGKTLAVPQLLFEENSERKQNYNIYRGDNNFDYQGFDIIEGEVFLVHRLNRAIKHKTAFSNSLIELFLLLTAVIMAYMIYYSRVLVIRVGQLANTDPLTSLLNRRAMENAVLPLLSLNKRYDQNICFLLGDIDYFKKVNDAYGHTVGDEVLVMITSILKSCLRSSDIISRHGGEEFLIVLPQTDLESGFLLAERIRTSIENTRTGEQRVAVTMSIGCIEVEEADDYDSAIIRADNMLYKAKNDGRNRTITSIDNQNL